MRYHPFALLCLVIALVAGGPAVAAPAFSPAATDACVAKAAATSAARSGNAVLDCIGRSAQACMAIPGGDTTVGMMDCLKGELAYWDGKLNAAYAKRLAADKKSDAELKQMGSAAPRSEPALRKMQRAWIAYRDAACAYEQSQWMGGTGGGPATMDCHMQETARQALKLDGWWSR
jgi:uncharacterized protein YecT (DUF1311 family)